MQTVARIRSFAKRAAAALGLLALVVTCLSFSPSAYAQASYDVLREKWKERLIGTSVYNPSDPDMEAVVASQDSLALGYYTSYHPPTSSQPCSTT